MNLISIMILKNYETVKDICILTLSFVIEEVIVQFFTWGSGVLVMFMKNKPFRDT